MPTEDELNLLSELIGKNLLEVKFDGWSAQLIFKSYKVSVTPDELYFPSESNPNGDIVTLRINKLINENQQIFENSVLLNCGEIVEIKRLESIVEIENPIPVEKTEILGVEIPSGQGWTNNIYHPKDNKERINEKRTLLGLQFETNLDFVFTLFSDAVGFFVHIKIGKELPKELKEKCEIIKTSHHII